MSALIIWGCLLVLGANWPLEWTPKIVRRIGAALERLLDVKL